MKSRWFELKPTALALRKSGLSIKDIERKLGIPRSTLSGWFRGVVLDDSQIARLQKNKEEAWAKARINGVLWHKAQKAARIAEAEADAGRVLDRLTISNDIIDLALAMLYLGEGAKGSGTSLASSDPNILRFTLAALERVYQLPRTKIKCDLHLRMDQDKAELIGYWADQLLVPVENFRHVSFDKRTEGRPTYENYKGVCVLVCGNIAIQRKLINLYNLFCERVALLDMGA